jgi:outer membrane protein OmpA-like peptidoglycan-associated protein
LTQKLNDMTSIVREALVLPPAVTTPSPAPAPALAPRQAPQSQSPQPLGRTPEKLSFDLPKEAYSVNKNGVVIRVFHDLARTDFEPSPEVAQALRTTVRDADSVWVRGRTDSESPDAINRLIAIERAVKARAWLVANGVPAAKITTRFSSSGLFLADNATQEGKALNRRVEIDIRHSAAS